MVSFDGGNPVTPDGANFPYLSSTEDLSVMLSNPTIGSQDDGMIRPRNSDQVMFGALAKSDGAELMAARGL